MTQVQNKFFPPPQQSGADTLPYGDPEENEGRESEEISIRKRGAVKSDWSKGRRYRRRKRLIDYDPSLDYEMIGPAISQFTGFNEGKRWHSMTIPSTVPPGFLSSSTPAPYQGTSGSGHAIGTGPLRRTIQEQLRHTAEVRTQEQQRHTAELRALEGKSVMKDDVLNTMEAYSKDMLLAAAKKAIRDGVAVPSRVKELIRKARKTGANAIAKRPLTELIIDHESLHEAVMRDLEEAVRPRRGRPPKGSTPGVTGREEAVLAWQRSVSDFMHPDSRLSVAPRPLSFSTDPINMPTSTYDPIPVEDMRMSEAQRGVRDSAVNPELTPHHGRDFRPPREEKASGRMPAHMEYEGGGKGGEGYRDAGNRHR